MAQEVEHDVRVALTKEEEDRVQVKQELHSVKSVNETLIKQVALLESKNRELPASWHSPPWRLPKLPASKSPSPLPGRSRPRIRRLKCK